MQRLLQSYRSRAHQRHHLRRFRMSDIFSTRSLQSIQHILQFSIHQNVSSRWLTGRRIDGWLYSKSIETAAFNFNAIDRDHLTMVGTLRFKLPKPRNCLGFIDLQTATEVITIFTLVNKVSGFYGILSVFTGSIHCRQMTSDNRRANFTVANEHVHMVHYRHSCMSMGTKADP